MYHAQEKEYVGTTVLQMKQPKSVFANFSMDNE